MTLDEFLLTIYEMGKGHEQLAVSTAALEQSIGFEFGTLHKKAYADGYLDSSAGRVRLTASGKGRIALFQ